MISMRGLSRKLIKKQAGSFVCLLVMLIFGCCAITLTSLFIRSAKWTEMNEGINKVGDYEAIIYNADIGFENTMMNSAYIDDAGLYYELGTATNASETSGFRAIAFRDELSEEIYHMSCLSGSYPTSEDEVAIDISVANAYGIPSVPGQELSLNLYDENGNLATSREYRVSGVFRASDNDVVGGWYRCPFFSAHEELYTMPGIVFHSSVAENVECSKEVVFVRAKPAVDTATVEHELEGILKSDRSGAILEVNARRQWSYSSFLGLDFDEFERKYGALCRENIHKAISDGVFKRDFYSSVLFPVISVLIICTEVASIYALSKNIISDRKEHYAVLRCVGMSSKRIIRDLIIEMAIFGIVGSIVGIGLGITGHVLLIRILNSKMHLRLLSGLTVIPPLRRVTFDPVITSFVVCLLSMALSLAIPLYRLYKMYPSELLATSDEVFTGKITLKKRNKTKYKGGWLRLLNRRIDLHDGVTMAVLAIVISTMLFGYVFFRSYSEYQTMDERSYMESLGIDGRGYVVQRGLHLVDWGYNIANRHDAGITASFPDSLENNPDVDRYWAVIFNDSTRMVFDDEPDNELKQLLGNRRLNIFPVEDDPMIMDSIVAEKIIFELTDFDADAIMYNLPTVGLTDNEMIDLEDEVIAGSIDTDRIRSGEEVVLAVPEELADICIRRFPVGSQIPIDDIVLTEEEDRLNFDGSVDPKWVCYSNDVEISPGVTIPVGYCAFGTRHSFAPTVGAIVVLHKEEDKEVYLTSGSNWIRVQNLYQPNVNLSAGMSVLCLPESFASWGLPDRNYTYAKAILRDGVNIYDFDDFWYETLRGSVDVRTISTFDYVDVINVNTMRIMIIFYLLIAALILLGIVSVVTGLYTKTRGNRERFQTLRRVGLSVNQASWMIYTQNMFYPIIASLIAIIPIYATQSFFAYTLQRVQSGELSSSSNGADVPWYFNMPIHNNLFSFDFVPAFICSLLLGFLLIFIGTLPQILYLKRMKMIETREE